MADLPWTPDFEVWAVDHAAKTLAHTPDALSVVWSDGVSTRHHALLLRENSPDPGTIHPQAREMCASPTDFPDSLEITAAGIEESGAVSVSFSDGMRSAYHPGWLRGTAWTGDEEEAAPVLWSGEDRQEPPSFGGPEALERPETFLGWLEALRDYGLARLRGLPQRDGLLEEIVTRIGQVRESNFGRQYVLEIKDAPDSQAFTSEMLPQHIDLPTRECPHGLQFLYVRENAAKGGEGLYVDAYRIAEDMRREEPGHFHSLVTDVWEYSNRARKSDHRGRGPVIETDPAGRVTGIRYNTFLRAPLKAPLPVQARAYKAYRAFCARAQDRRHMMAFRYEPGDLLAFDNRRILHGRSGYEAKSGARRIEGIYSDRDDLHSRIRILRRQMRAGAQA